MPDSRRNRPNGRGAGAGGRSGKAGRPGGRANARALERERQLAEAARAEIPPAADVCVIGGGASGLACAIAAREAGARVVVLERDLACGRTILATGNGRCNFCNVMLAPENYNHPELAASVMGEPDEALEGVLGFFRDCGLSWIDEGGRLYPRSRQAASVRNVLLARCWREGVTLAPAREVTGAIRRHGRWYVTYRERWEGFDGDGSRSDGRGLRPAQDDDGHATGCLRTLPCRALVIASGGGTSRLASSLGLPLVAETPVLCAVAARAAAPSLLEALDGRRAHCVATLTRRGRVVLREPGEVLFRPYGLSGIVSFDLSRAGEVGDQIELDLAPEVDAWEVDHLVASRPNDTAALDGILDPVIAAELMRLAGGAGSGGLAWRVAPLVKGLPFRFEGLAEQSRAQVTRGGIDTTALDTDALALREIGGTRRSASASGHPQLYACGEALDVDGACGGFNLAWAWLSGLRAGTQAAARPELS